MSLALVNSLIDEVQAMAVSSPSVAATTASSSTRTGDEDVAFFPETPPGHTPYTWAGIGEPGPAAASTASDGKQKKKNPKGAAAAAGNKKQQQQNKQAGGNKKEKKKNAPKAAAAPATPREAFLTIDIRVGKITKVWKHPDAATLYCEEIDVGEPEPRKICSGLVPYVSEADMLGASLLVVCNLKPSKLRGIVSNGMVLATSVTDADGKKTQCELMRPPAGAAIGDRVGLAGVDMSEHPPAERIDAKKAKHAWQVAAPFMKNVGGVGTFDGENMVVGEAGSVTAPTIKDGPIS